MSDDEALEQQNERETESVFLAAEEWGRQFVKYLELEFKDAASSLPRDASSTDFRRVMLSAVVHLLQDSGANPEETIRLLEVSRNKLSSADAEIGWTGEENARRLELIDKWIQQALSAEESLELKQLTERMRARFDIEEFVPLEGARRLHRKLLGSEDSEQTKS